ncbi:MAG: glycosyltransferase family 39 protein [Verrucomicrobia bacterium]|nr:glycosyltransferase family 39 protein [Verrucomicrobiota bacterium]
MRRLAIFLIALGSIAVRLWRIDAPFDDRWSWRQSDVAAIARNYLENGFHFGRPQVVWAGNQPGFVGTEFPLLPFTAALIYTATGVHEWVGRTISLLFFASSLPSFYLIMKRASGAEAAIFALVFYSFAPLMIAASRAFMPDAPSLSCALAGLYLFWRWTEKNHERLALFGASLLMATSFLLKPTTATIAAPMALIAWQKFGWRIVFQRGLWFSAAIAVIPSAIWYSHAHAISSEFYPHHMFGAGGIRLMHADWYWRIAVQTCFSSLTPILFLLALMGAVTCRQLSIFRWWLAAMILFILVVGYGNRHEWYRLPLVPIAAAFAGCALSEMSQGRIGSVASALLLVLFGICSPFAVGSYLAPTSRSLWELGAVLRAQTPEGSLIVVADDGDPTALYYAHRKGWHFLERGGIFDGNPFDSAQLIADLHSLRQRGASYLAFYRGTSWWLDYYPGFRNYLNDSATLVSASPDYRIYHLSTHDQP